MDANVTVTVQSGAPDGGISSPHASEALAPAEAPAAATVAAGGPPAQRPDSFAVRTSHPSGDGEAAMESSVDPLLAGLLLARERLAYHQARVTTTTTTTITAAAHRASVEYHSGAVTSLVHVPAGPQPPPPLRPDVVDAYAAAHDVAQARAASASRQPQPLSSHRLLPVTGEKDAAEVGGGAGTPRHGKGKSTAHRRLGQSARRGSTSQPHRHRSLSRREEAHAARMAVALNPTFILPMHEQHRTAAAGAAQERRDGDAAAAAATTAAARDVYDGHGKKQKRRGGSVSGATPSIRVHPSPSTPTAAAADGSAARTSLEPPQRSRRRRGPSHRVHDAEVRHEEATGASAPAAAAAASAGEGDAGDAAAERAGDASHPDYDYDPDDADAAEALAEKVRLLRQQADDAAAGGHGRGLSVAALVRPAVRFHRGPAPAWVSTFSDALLFDTHALDDAVRRAEKESGMGGVVQLPVDAVVLRLRSDVARVRRLRDALVRDSCSAAATSNPLHTLRTVLFGSAYPSRAEVYDPVEPVLQSPATARADVDASAGDEEGLVVVGANYEHEAVASVDANKRRTREATFPITGALAATTAPSPSPAAITASKPTGPSPLLLDRSVEARDLRRPLLAQTIPVWRRRGAAVQLVGELLEHLQDRLCALEGQLADPALGALMELIGAPDSSGVDGRVESTYPPALERALRTTVTNTLLSDVFASAWTALPDRALRISEALRRRHTPAVHAEYFTCTDVRPVYDYTVLQSSRRAAGSRAAGLLLSAAATGAAGAASAAGHTGEASGGYGSGTAGNAGVDARKSYSVHVDYVRFQPSLEHIRGTSVLDGGAAAAAAATPSATNSGSGVRGAGSGSRRPSMPTATSDDPLSSLLLGSYANVFFTRDLSRAGGGGGAAAAGGPENSTSASSLADAVRAQSSEQGTSQHPSSSAATTASGWQQQQQQHSRGMSNTAAALLLALSASTAQHSLVAFSPEAYLTSLLLQYYEQYRLLQLNLLPGLKNRFFYLEQVAQLQRQPKRDTDLEQLQARLEALAATSADVERGCLHVMVLLWNSVLLLRRRARSAAPPAAAPNAFGSDIELHEMQAVVPHHGGGATEGSGEGGDAEDPPIIVAPAASPATAGRAARHSTRPQRHSHQHAPQQQQRRSGDGTPTRAEVRAHPPVFTAEAPQSTAGTLDAAAAVHRVDKSVTYGDCVEGHGREGGSSPQVPGAIPAHQHPLRDPVYSPDATAAATPSASASPLLAPLQSVSVSGDASGHGGLRGGVNDVHAAAAAAAEAARQWHDVDAAAPLAPQQSPQQQQPPRRFRFYLRRYGTTQETPYTAGDELLNYAAEVEGADVLAPARGLGAPSMDADELVYFQLVVFARSHAAMVPQYVGCTTPRPMTAAKVVFFNETFEVRALHEPAELLLHLIPVTAGPAKHTVASTVRLRPTLTRTYTVLPLQPPTAFVFHGRLFTQHSRHVGVGVGVGGGGAASAARTAASVHGVLAVSTTWTSSHGLTIPQVERLFLGGPDGTRGVADPLDPQYLPLLRMLRSYYTEVEAAAAAGADGQGGGTGRRAGGGGRHGRGRHSRHSERPRSHGRSNTAPPASAADRARAYEQHHPHTSDAEDGASNTTIRAGMSHGRRGRDAHGEAGSQGSAGLGFRTASALAHVRLRRQASNLGLPPQQQRGGAGLARVGSSARLLGPQNQQQYRRRASLDAATAAVVAAAGGARDASGLRGMRRMITAGGISVGGLAGDAALVGNVGLGGGTAGGGGGVGGGLVVNHELFALQEVLVRLPSERLRHLHRRWMIRTNRIKAADEVEARLFARPMPLDDEDAYQLQKAMRRVVAKEEVERVKDYGAAAGALFNVDHYYRAPSAVSGLALSPLPRETKLKLWRERQRRMLLTLKAKRRVTDAERLEAVVRVPKLAMKLVFDFAPRGQLNPHRKERPKTEDIDRAVVARRHDSRIVIHIMKAHNLPLRADGTPLEPFVQASFVSEAAYTRSEVGSNPSWFQSLELPFQPLDFEEDTLGMIDDDVILSLYDKVEVKMAPSAVTAAAVAHETHYRTERRFIGTLHIPFYSLHQASQARMEGVYPLRMPRWILGYNTTLPSADGTGDGGASPQPHVFAGRGAVEMRSDTLDANQGPNPFFHSSRADRHEGGDAPSLQSPEPSQQRGTPDATATPVPVVLAPTTNRTSSESQTVEPTVQLYLSLWPPLQREPAPGLSRDELARKVGELNVSPQLRYLHQVALKWQKVAARKVKSIGSINAQASARQVEPFVLCSTGDLVLVCRYLLPRGGPPPPSVRTVYEAIRYVSLLPFVADMLSWGEKDVWSTNAELLASRSGDYEELALLLVHFLRHLAPNRPTFAVLGSGTIYQQTIMVLHAFDDGEWMLIDPRSGWTVSAGKPYGTVLRDVYMVVSHDQIWANVQLSGLPHRMTWDLTNPAHWLPCFDAVRDARIAVCTPHLFPIQREVLSFLPADAVKSREIELELRSCLKKALLTWRNSCPPAYHRGVELILRELLEAAEAERCLCGSARRTDVTASAAARLSEYFGENLMGVNASPAVGAAETDDLASAAARHQQQQQRHRRGGRRSHSRRGRGEGGDGADADAAVDGGGGTSAMERSDLNITATPAMTLTSAVSPLRLIGSPVMGSYNPSDPQFQELLHQVFECAVHEVGTSEVSFAVGTYVKSYTGDVCAIWIFLVAICRG